jgi:hypothetical protein
MTNTNDAIAAFLAKGGKVRKLDASASSGISDREFFLASRGEIDLKRRDWDAERADEQMREKFAEARTVGVPSDVAYLFATGQIECCSCADLVSDEARAHAKTEARRIERKR